jgi:hypothetical protein
MSEKKSWVQILVNRTDPSDIVAQFPSVAQGGAIDRGGDFLPRNPNGRLGATVARRKHDKSIVLRLQVGLRLFELLGNVVLERFSGDGELPFVLAQDFELAVVAIPLLLEVDRAAVNGEGGGDQAKGDARATTL